MTYIATVIVEIKTLTGRGWRELVTAGSMVVYLEMAMGEAKRRGTLEQRRIKALMARAEREEVARLKELNRVKAEADRLRAADEEWATKRSVEAARPRRSKSRMTPSLLASALMIGCMR